MAHYLVVHTVDPALLSRESEMRFITDLKAFLDSFTEDTYCISIWDAVEAGIVNCLWEAPSKQAIMDVLAKSPAIPVDGIHPAIVVDVAKLR